MKLRNSLLFCSLIGSTTLLTPQVNAQVTNVADYAWNFPSVSAIATNADLLITDLREYVQEVLDAGQLAPIRISYSDQGNETYFQHYEPGRILTTLAWAYPHLSALQKADVQTYVSNALSSTYFSPLSSYPQPFTEGARREYHQIYKHWDTNYNNDVNKRPRVHTLYGLWLYGYRSGDWTEISNRWSSIKSMYNSLAPGNRSYSDEAFFYGPMSANIAIIRMAWQFGDTTMQTQALTRLQQYMDWGLDFAQTEEYAENHPTHPWESIYLEMYPGPHGGTDYLQCWPFINLSPEIARYMNNYTEIRTNALARLDRATNTLGWTEWYIPHAPYFTRYTGEEGVGFPSEVLSAIFNLEYWFNGKNAATLRSYFISRPSHIGDSYYIEPLVQAIEAHGTQEWKDIRNPPTDPVLQLSPPALTPGADQGTDATADTFDITRSGTGTVNYTITYTSSWISSISPTNGNTTGESDTITVTYNTAALAVGSYHGGISITSTEATNSPLTLDVSLTIISLEPALTVSAATLTPVTSEGANAAADTFDVSRTGTGTVSYTISETSSWISVISPPSGSTTGEADEITVTYDTDTLADGNYSTIITLTSTEATNSPVTVSVNLSVNPVQTGNLLTDGTCTSPIQSFGWNTAMSASYTNAWLGYTGSRFVHDAADYMMMSNAGGSGFSSHGLYQVINNPGPGDYDLDLDYIKQGSRFYGEMLRVGFIQSGEYLPNQGGSGPGHILDIAPSAISNASGWASYHKGFTITSSQATNDYLILSARAQINSNPGDVWMFVDNLSIAVSGVTENADADADGMDDSWEQQHFGNTSTATTNSDSDADGMLDWQEFVAGTQPTNAASRFMISSSQVTANENVLQWDAITGRTYSVFWNTNLLNIDQLLISNIAAGAAGNISFTDTLHNAETRVYYRISVRQ